MNIQAAKSEAEAVRGLLDDLLEKSRLYNGSNDYQKLLDFVVRLRNFAPFNAMLLQIQKPGLSYAASQRDWLERFGRQPKPEARPLLILWTFGPVALVYDVMDTVGDVLPEDVATFPARGRIETQEIARFGAMLASKHIYVHWIDAGDRKAGSIRLVDHPSRDEETRRYRLEINKSHPPPVQFATLAHELGHLCLGHLGRDAKFQIPERPPLDHAERELEAESVAYIVCRRNGVKPKSQTYLSDFVNERTTPEGIGVYQVMRAAGQVATLLGMRPPSLVQRPSTSSTSEMLTPAEIEQLRQRGRERSEYCKRAFAHLKPTTD